MWRPVLVFAVRHAPQLLLLRRRRSPRPMKPWILSGAIALTLAVSSIGIAGSASAQRVDDMSVHWPTDSMPSRIQTPSPEQPLVGVASFVGSAAGLLAGWRLGGVVYDATGCCGGGDDPGLTGRVVIGLASSALLATALPAIASPRPTSAFANAAVVGMLPAALAGYGAHAVSDGSAAVAVLSYATVHALFITLVSPHL